MSNLDVELEVEVDILPSSFHGRGSTEMRIESPRLALSCLFI